MKCEVDFARFRLNHSEIHVLIAAIEPILVSIRLTVIDIDSKMSNKEGARDEHEASPSNLPFIAVLLYHRQSNLGELLLTLICIFDFFICVYYAASPLTTS